MSTPLGHGLRGHLARQSGRRQDRRMGNLGPSEDDEDFGEIRVPEEWEAGVYANTSTVTFTPDEFTIDLIRLNPYRSGGVVVARISCSANTARHLTLNLVSQLRLWAETVISEGGGNGNGLPL
jgi:hypothetical protein